MMSYWPEVQIAKDKLKTNSRLLKGKTPHTNAGMIPISITVKSYLICNLQYILTASNFQITDWKGKKMRIRGSSMRKCLNYCWAAAMNMSFGSLQFIFGSPFTTSLLVQFLLLPFMFRSNSCSCLISIFLLINVHTSVSHFIFFQETLPRLHFSASVLQATPCCPAAQPTTVPPTRDGAWLVYDKMER
jgi:hypothetical protein